MPRRQRVGSAGVIFHVMNRSAKRAGLFEQSIDYLSFEKLLAESRARVQIPLLAYCLMPNHWHLVVWPAQDGDLSQFMHLLTSTHAQRWNAQRRLSGVGAVYQGRFKAIAVQCDDHFLRVCRYVERNPVRAGLVSTPLDWRWCSLWRRENPSDDTLLSPWPVARPGNWLELLQAPAKDEVEGKTLQTPFLNVAHAPVAGGDLADDPRLPVACADKRAERLMRPIGVARDNQPDPHVEGAQHLGS